MIEKRIVYFDSPGSQNTQQTLNLATRRAEEGDIGKALVASTSGNTGVLAMNSIENVEIIVISHSHGFKEPNSTQFTPENREAIEGRGGKILTCQHTFGGVGRAVRKAMGTFQLDEIIAQTLRNFGDGTKVCVEMALMAADAGLVRHGENIITIAGSDRGADTAMIIRAANAHRFFDLRIQEIICKPLFN